jgi:hypothetical protein
VSDSANEIIRPYFFVDYSTNAATAITENFLTTAIELRNLLDALHQQDSTTCPTDWHTVHTVQTFQELFANRAISRNGDKNDKNLSPRSSDLSTDDLFCGGSRKKGCL